jgi:L-lactate dehydrogenase complex protein LldG
VSELSGARADVLTAVRRAVGGPHGDRAGEYASIERHYTRAGRLDAEGRLALFASRLQHYDVGVRRARPDSLAAEIGEACAARGRRRMLVPAGVPASAVPGSIDVIPDDDLSYEALDRCDGVLTMATVAIALTGTIVLTHREGEGRRAATLIPDYHVCVVRAGQVVETVPEAVRQLQAFDPALVTTISGPSATADIEMIRVRGVHGPRTLDVVIVSE